MEEIVNTETQEEIERKREFHRVIDKTRNLQKPNELGQRTSRQQAETIQPDLEIPEFEDAETMSSGSENTIAVPATKFKRYLGATGVRYINMGLASKIQTNNEWDLEKRICQIEQKFATDLKTISGEQPTTRSFFKNTDMHRKKPLNKYQKSTKNTKKTIINKVRRCLLRRQDNHSPGAEKNDYYFTTQGTSSN